MSPVRQHLTTDSVTRVIDAPAEVLYDIVSDITRTPELSEDIVSCEWLDGATGPAVGARFKAVNTAGRGPRWSNKPVVVAADRGREFAISRTEKIGGTLEWRYRFTPEGTGTRVEESYEVTKPLPWIGWFLIGKVYGLSDRRRDLRASMERTLERLAEVAAREPARAS
jgi:hypothetical protein